MKESKKIFLILLLVLGIMLVTIGTTYAFLSYSKEGTKSVTMSAGSVKLHYQENSLKSINLTNALPMDETRGKAQTNYFEFTITSETAGYAIPYYVTSRVNTIEANRIPAEYITLYLTEVVSGEEQEVLLTTYDALTDVSKNNHIEQQLMNNTVLANTSNYEKVYRLRMWINETADYSPTEEAGVQTYPMEGKSFEFIVNVYTEVDAAPQVCIQSFTPVGTLQNPGTTSTGTPGGAVQTAPQLTIGDEVSVGTEHFIVVSSDADETVLLAKYPMTIYDYATPIGSEDDLQFNGAGISGYNPNVKFSSENYWDETVSDYSTNPIVYNPTKVTEPTYDNHTCIPVYQYKTYFHDTLGIAYDDEDEQDYELNKTQDEPPYDYTSNLYLYYANRYSNLVGSGSSSSCAYPDNYKNPDGELPGYNAGRNNLTGDNIDYSVAFYVNRYKNKLETINNGINIDNARLLTYDEAELFANNNIEVFDSNDYSYYGFWLANAESEWSVFKMDRYDGIGSTNYDSDYAVRPVLEVPTCAIDLD